MVNILLAHNESETGDQLPRFLKVGLAGQEVHIETTGDYRASTLGKPLNYQVCLLHENGLGAGINFAQDILRSQGKPSIIALLSGHQILASETSRLQALSEAGIQFIEPWHSALCGFYIGDAVKKGLDNTPMKFDGWLEQVGLYDALYHSTFTSTQMCEFNRRLLELGINTTEGGFLFRPPRDFISAHQEELGIPQLMFEQMFGRSQKER